MRISADDKFLDAALGYAVRGCGHTRPNPPVGAVIVKGGKIIGAGWHRRAGTDHAEVAAIRNATRRGNSVRHATMYVTLEPCSKPGRVGACTDAIASAGIGRVIYGAADPNPVNRGKAKRALAKFGIGCERSGSTVATERCERLIKAFSKHVTTGLPYVTVKIAMSLDGRICDDFGDARWVSSERARRTTGSLREQVDAIMVGAETIRRDNPSLLSHGRRNDDLIRVVVSKSGRLPKSSQVFTDGRNQTLVFKDAASAIKKLGAMGVLHVLCEGGLKLATSLAETGLVDEWLTVLSPKVIGHRRIGNAVVVAKANCLLDIGINPGMEVFK